MTRSPLALLILLMVAAQASLLQTSASAADLATLVQPLIEAHEGQVAVVIRHLDSGEQFAWREDVVQPTASLIKLPERVWSPPENAMVGD